MQSLELRVTVLSDGTAALYFTVLYFTVLYFTLLHYTALYCILLYCTALSCTAGLVLNCAVLYHVMLVNRTQLGIFQWIKI